MHISVYICIHTYVYVYVLLSLGLGFGLNLASYATPQATNTACEACPGRVYPPLTPYFYSRLAPLLANCYVVLS